MLPFVFLCVAALPPSFPPDVDPSLFPGVADRTSAELELAGLAALYPGHILRSPPRVNDPANAGRAAKTVDLPRDVTYMRIYDLGASLPQVADKLSKPALILDLRYVVADAVVSEALADLFSKAGLASAPVHGIGTIHDPNPLPMRSEADKDRPAPVVLVMVNGQTAGPLEAWLEAFQEKQSVLAVGTPTAGQPGKYHALQGQPGSYIIEGELQPDSGSIVGTGLQPRFLVDVTPQQNDLAYFSVERGTSDILSMLRKERTAVVAPAATGGAANTTAAPATQQNTTVTTEASDPVLQRAVDVVAALQVLGRVPSSKDTGTAKTPAAATTTPLPR